MNQHKINVSNVMILEELQTCICLQEEKIRDLEIRQELMEDIIMTMSSQQVNIISRYHECINRLNYLER